MTRSIFFLIVAVITCVNVVRGTLPDPLSLGWSSLGTLNIYSPEPIGYTSDNEIGYFFGRTLGDTPNSRFNFSDGTWTPLPDLPTAIAYPCVVLVPNGDLYIIGGGNTIAAANSTVYKLAAGSTSYETLAELKVPRFQHRCAYDEATNRIYAIGGVSTAPGYPLVSGEYYSITDNTWTMIANRSDDGTGFAMINVGDGHLYTFNGYTGTKRIQQYSIANDKWTIIGSMTIGNALQTAAYYKEENVIFLFGGISTVDGCQYFNLTSKTLVNFMCLETERNVTVSGTYGTFIPSTRTFYYVAIYIQRLYTASFDTASTPMQIPSAQPSSTTPSIEIPPASEEDIPSGQSPTTMNVPAVPKAVPSSNTSNASGYFMDTFFITLTSVVVVLLFC